MAWYSVKAQGQLYLLNVEEWLILKLIPKIGYEDGDWIYFCQDRNQWRVLQKPNNVL
jgi:hypothetical protein